MSIVTYWLCMIVTTLISKCNTTPSCFQSARLVISNECVSSSFIAYTLKKVIHQVSTIFYVFSIGAIVNPLVTSCWWYSSACSKGPLHTSAEPSLSTSSASNHDFFTYSRDNSYKTICHMFKCIKIIMKNNYPCFWIFSFRCLWIYDWSN